jgi:hypothetical protein
LPAADVDVAKLGVEVGKIALQERLPILFLALATDLETDSFNRRRLSTLGWLAKDNLVETNTRLLYEANWLQALEHNLKSGDLLVCLAGERMPGYFFPGQALPERLVTDLRVPVFVFAAIAGDRKRAGRVGWRSLLGWSLAIAVIILFGLFQAFIEGNLDEPFSTLVIGTSVIAEISIIWKMIFLQ